ncbi:uncharacterized protein TRIADDRAFT_54806 [Trichoplax adhaerens]|uniref:Solute carrier family 12 member 3 n=1 Tax=Trichoplax adhaerens TaxID=10228 RepID=B3RT19_TRIAD|nr:hypothetical protein TRIADDRAFT_54806 [Trichoplax adhaerens]EDV26617.1 hypothetical protein TRIADDRAFT_54806 [Trichoplax adhaerens]|eukprot:XP_002110613.1 hypothetical protein TRIADDRAFT_54806 [Trichoplax adhaerens]
MDQKSELVNSKFRVKKNVIIESTEENDDIRSHASSNADEHQKTLQFTALNSSYFTTDALPMMTYYKQTLTSRDTRRNRPTLQDLHEPRVGTNVEEGRVRKMEKSKSVDAGGTQPEGPSKFGWIQGVLIRCLLNIWGVMLFLRLSWVVGEAGIGFACLIILLAATVTTITTLSMSAICSNGEVKGGGAIGLVFSAANSIGVALYIVGFAESVKDYLKAINITLVDEINDVRIIGVIAATIVFAIAMSGVAWESKAQVILFVLLIAAILNCIVGSIMYSFIMPADKVARGFTGLSAATFLNNTAPKFSPTESFFTVFGVFFPAATGILAGANISANLKEPSKSIPIGTLLAILISTIAYLGLACLFGSAVERSTIFSSSNNTYSLNCTAGCRYGLRYDNQVASMISGWEPLTAAGIFAATISSALASMIGAPNILQAVGADRLFPYLEFFSVGNGERNEPRRGIALTYIVALIFIAIAELNYIAPIISNFFLIAYALINYSCFDASQARSPGWRPSFKFYSKWCSLVGALTCVAVMFVINWWAALITIAVVIGLYKYIDYSKPVVNWGSSGHARQYINALDAAYKLNTTVSHVKNFRPQCLVLCGIPSERLPLVKFASNFTNNYGLLICGNVMQEKSNTDMKDQYKILQENKIKAVVTTVTSTDFILGARALMQASGLGKLSPNMILFGFLENWQNRDDRIENYVAIIHDAFDLNFGVAIFRDRLEKEKGENNFDKNLQESGEGVRFCSNRTKEGNNLGGEVVDFGRGVLSHNKPGKSDSKLSNNFKELLKQPVEDKYVQLKEVRKIDSVIDIWWIYDDGGLTILIPYLLSLSKRWSNCKLRIFTPGKPEKLRDTMIGMTILLKKFRIEYENVIAVGDINEEPSEESMSRFCQSFPSLGHIFGNSDIENKTKIHIKLSELLIRHSMEASLVVITLPVPRKNFCPPSVYMSWLETISGPLPCPVLLVRGNQTSVLTFNS